jgi:hypothetical protein
MDCFSSYYKSVKGLGTEEKRILQVKKTNNFFQLAKGMLEKHFRKWVSELLYLSLFLEGPTAGVVSRFIFPNVVPCSVQEQESYYSKMHKQNINILKFKEFLIGHVSIVKMYSNYGNIFM